MRRLVPLVLVLFSLAACGKTSENPEAGVDPSGNSAGGGELSAAGDQRIIDANRVIADFCAKRASAGRARQAAREVAGVVRREGPNATFYSGSQTTGRRPVVTVARRLRDQLQRCGGPGVASPLDRVG